MPLRQVCSKFATIPNSRILSDRLGGTNKCVTGNFPCPEKAARWVREKMLRRREKKRGKILFAVPNQYWTDVQFGRHAKKKNFLLRPSVYISPISNMRGVWEVGVFPLRKEAFEIQSSENSVRFFLRIWEKGEYLFWKLELETGT